MELGAGHQHVDGIRAMGGYEECPKEISSVVCNTGEAGKMWRILLRKLRTFYQSGRKSS
jgi:hypothetical protein